MKKVLLVGWCLVVLFQVVPAWGMEKKIEHKDISLKEELIASLSVSAAGGPEVVIESLELESKQDILAAVIKKLNEKQTTGCGVQQLFYLIHLCAQYDNVVQKDALKDISLDGCEGIIAGIEPFTEVLSRKYSMTQVDDWKKYGKRKANLSVGLRTKLIESQEKNGCYELSLFLPDLPSGCLDSLDKQKVATMFDTCLKGSDDDQAQKAKQILENLSPSDLQALIGNAKDNTNLVAKIKRNCTREKIRLTYPEELSWGERLANFASWFTPIASAACFWWVGKLLKTNGKNKWAKVGALAAAGVGTMWAEKKINKHFERYGFWESSKLRNFCALLHGYRRGSAQQNIQQVVQKSFEKQI